MKRPIRRPFKTGQPNAPADQAEPARPAGPLPFYVAALGASAGGLEALSSFFEAVPPDSGLAYVVVQHLSPTYKSQLAQLLARRTSMPVAQVTDGMGVEANHVHVIPPDRCMSLRHGQLALSPFSADPGPRLPIDHFFRSLAQDQGERSIGISLSGTGSDGVRGLRAIKEAGGLVLVQDERSAQFSAMPHNAIATGVADRILPVAEMPAQLHRFVNHPLLVRPPRNGGRPPERVLERLSALLRAQTGVDFSGYKPSTLARRLERRMGLSQIVDVDRYLDFLQHTPEEMKALGNDFLISVTRFFRDPEAFQRLKETAIPALFTDAGKERSIRVWVPGCATGEEAYSVAMLLEEHAATRPEAYSIKVFATDANAAAIGFAGTGRYPASVAADVPSELLARHFTKEGDAYRVRRHLRERVTFAVQNLLHDPPFARVNLICCRNLLIYLQPPWQQTILAAFQFALQPRGWLFLGSSETVGERQPAFVPLDPKARLYRKRGHGLRAPAIASGAASKPRPAGGRVDPGKPVAGPEALQTALYATLLADFVPTGFVVDERNEVLHSFGQPAKFTSFPSGPARLNLLKLVPRALASTLHAALRRARKEKAQVSCRGVKWAGPEGTRLLHVTVKPMPARDDLPAVHLIFLEEAGAAPTTPAREGWPADGPTREQVMALEADLQTSQEDLATAVQQGQAAHEESQTSHEELLAANEELQSGLEELESINEELSTLNAEYQRKNEELLVSNNDLENLLRTAEIGTIFLDEALRIRRFTPVAAAELNLLAGDVGRLLTDLAHPLVRELARAAQQALTEGKATDVTVDTPGHGAHLLRISPYAREGACEQGVVATILNVSQLKARGHPSPPKGRKPPRHAAPQNPPRSHGAPASGDG